jgi:hypothetical protein
MNATRRELRPQPTPHGDDECRRAGARQGERRWVTNLDGHLGARQPEAMAVRVSSRTLAQCHHR